MRSDKQMMFFQLCAKLLSKKRTMILTKFLCQSNQCKEYQKRTLFPNRELQNREWMSLIAR